MCTAGAGYEKNRLGHTQHPFLVLAFRGSRRESVIRWEKPQSCGTKSIWNLNAGPILKKLTEKSGPSGTQLSFTQALRADMLTCLNDVCLLMFCSWTRPWTLSAAQKISSLPLASMVWWRCHPSPWAPPSPSPNTSVPSVATAPQVPKHTVTCQPVV